MQMLMRIIDVCKQYGDVKALDAVSLDIYCGEIISLLGVNGAGKTTLSSIIASLHPATSGDIIMNGKSIYQDIVQYRRMIGYCQQKPNLNNAFTVRENLIFAGRYFGMSDEAIKERIIELTQYLGLEKYLDRNPATLSGGYKQRCMLARSLMHNPQLLILDEPTVALDPHIRHQLWEYIKVLRDRGLSILLTTHYLDEAEILSDRVCVLDKGRVQLIDSPANLMSSYNKSRLEDVFLQLMNQDTEE